MQRKRRKKTHRGQVAISAGLQQSGRALAVLHVNVLPGEKSSHELLEPIRLRSCGVDLKPLRVMDSSIQRQVRGQANR